MSLCGPYGGKKYNFVGRSFQSMGIYFECGKNDLTGCQKFSIHMKEKLVLNIDSFIHESLNIPWVFQNYLEAGAIMEAVHFRR